MCLSNKQMDRAVEMAEADTANALEHCADNSADYVAGRYGYLYGRHGYPVPVRAGTLVQLEGRLFPASRRSQRDGAYDVRSAWPQPGIVATLMDEANGEIGDYRVESNGLNGVEVTSRV